MSVIKHRYLTKYDMQFLLGQVQATRLVTVYGAQAWSLCVTIPKVHISHSVVSISLDLLRSMWLACNLHHMLTWSKLSLLGYRQLTQISSIPGYEPWFNSGANALMSMMTTLSTSVYHLLSTCHVYMELGIKFLVSGYV